MILASEGPKIFSTTSSCYLSKPIPTHLSFAITVYPNCVLVIINEAGSVGSIIRGTAQFQDSSSSLEDIDPEDYHKTQQTQNSSHYIYECKVLFGSTEIQFYEFVMRRLVEIVFEERKMPTQTKGQKSKVFLNIALSKVNSQAFKENSMIYYEAIVKKLRQILTEVI